MIPAPGPGPLIHNADPSPHYRPFTPSRTGTPGRRRSQSCHQGSGYKRASPDCIIPHGRGAFRDHACTTLQPRSRSSPPVLPTALVNKLFVRSKLQQSGLYRFFFVFVFVCLFVCLFFNRAVIVAPVAQLESALGLSRKQKLSAIPTQQSRLKQLSTFVDYYLVIVCFCFVFSLMNWITHLSAYIELPDSLALTSREPHHLISHLSRSLADCWGTTVDVTTSFLHSSRFSAFRSMIFTNHSPAILANQNHPNAAPRWLSGNWSAWTAADRDSNLALPVGLFLGPVLPVT